MEIRTVKFNLKQFIEDYRFYHESRDRDSEEELLHNFETIYSESSFKIRSGMRTFLYNSDVARQYPVLQQIASRCDANF